MSPRRAAPPEPFVAQEPSVGIVISPLPRAKPKPKDDFEEHNARMRSRGAAMYRALQEGPVGVTPESLSTVVWLRQHGMRIRAAMRAEGSVYLLEGVMKNGVFVPHVPEPVA